MCLRTTSTVSCGVFVIEALCRAKYFSSPGGLHWTPTGCPANCKKKGERDTQNTSHKNDTAVVYERGYQYAWLEVAGRPFWPVSRGVRTRLA